MFSLKLQGRFSKSQIETKCSSFEDNFALNYVGFAKRTSIYHVGTILTGS